MYAKHCILQLHAKNADMQILSVFNYRTIEKCKRENGRKRMKPHILIFYLKLNIYYEALLKDWRLINSKI